MSKTKEDQIDELVKKKLDSLLSIVDLTGVVTIDKIKGLVYVGGEKLDEIQLQNLKAEADFLAASSIWKLIYETPKELAQRAMFVQGETLADMQKGKTMLYTLSVQKNIIDVFKSYQKK